MALGRAGFERFDLWNIECRVGHVVEKIREATDHHAGDDFHDLGIPETGLTNRLQFLVTDFASAFQNGTGEFQCGISEWIRGSSLATVEHVTDRNSPLLAKMREDRVAIVATIGLARRELDLVIKLIVDFGPAHRRTDREKTVEHGG